MKKSKYYLAFLRDKVFLCKIPFAFIFLMLFLLFVSCSKSNDSERSGDSSDVLSTKRTVLIYVAASNNLSPFSRDDIQEMERGICTVSDLENCNVLLYLQEGEGSYRSQPVLKRLVRKYNSQGKLVGTWDKVKEYPEQNSLDVAVMSKVYQDTFTEFPAASYGLVLWSHSDGWLEGTPQSITRWYGQDKFKGKSYHMDILDLKKSLEVAPHLDFILFDCCLMQSVEVAYELRHQADYMLGSPAEIPGPGAPYDKLVPVFFSANKHIVHTLASTYYEHYAETYTGVSSSNKPWYGGVSMTILNLRQMDQFVEKTRNLLESVGLEYEELQYEDVFYYDPGRKFSIVYYYDLASVIEKSVPRAAFLEWKSSFDQLVEYFKTTKTNFSGVAYKDFSMKGSNGVSVYIPKSSSIYDKENNYYRKLSWYNSLARNKGLK